MIEAYVPSNNNSLISTTQSLLRFVCVIPITITSTIWFTYHIGKDCSTSSISHLTFQTITNCHQNNDFMNYYLGCNVLIIWTLLPAILTKKQSTIIFHVPLQIIQYYTFYWIYPTIKKQHVDVQDLPPLPTQQHPKHVHVLFENMLPNTGMKLLDTLIRRIQPGRFWFTMLHGFTFLVCMTMDPLLIHWLLSSSPSSSKLHDIGLVIILFISMLIRVSCMEVCFFNSVVIMATARSAIVMSVFKHTLNFISMVVPDNNNNNNESIDVANLMSSDADKIGASGWVVFFLAQWTFALFSLPITVYVLSTFVGVQASLVCVLCVLIGGTISRRLGNISQPFNRELQEKRDVRSGLVRDVLERILSVKLVVGEEIWLQQLLMARKNELHSLVKVRVISALNGLVASLVGVLVPISIFTWYTRVSPHKPLEPSVAFAALASITQISWSIATLPSIYDLWASLKPSGDRLVSFLMASANEQQQQLPSINANLPSSINKSSLPFLKLSSARIPVGNQHALFDVDLEIERNSLVLVSGPVGGGKSSLLAVIAGARNVLQGQVQLPSHRAYVEQKPFLLNGTLRDNVIFAEEETKWNSDRYQDALSRAQLQHDLNILPKHDATLVGDRGVQLSGGQRTRVALARALYSNADVFIFDDVLAAVDAHTGDLLRRQVILYLLEQGKTVILSTNQNEMMLESLALCKIMKLEVGNGQVICTSSENTTATPPPPPYNNNNNGNNDDVIVLSRPSSTTNHPIHHNSNTNVTTATTTATLAEFIFHLRSSLSQRIGRVLDSTLIDSMEKELSGEMDDDERDMTKRDTLGGTISWHDVHVYLKTYGMKVPYLNQNTTKLISIILVLVLIIIVCFFEVASPFWLSHWTQSGKDGLIIYCGLNIGQILSTMILSIVTTLCAMEASIELHNLGITRVLFAPMSIFDGQPAGRLFNMLSSDLRNIDESVPDSGLYQLRKTLTATTQLAIIGFLIPFVLLLLPILIPVYLFILGQVRSPSRDVKRAESLAHGPVYSLFFDILRGKETIKAFGREEEFQYYFGNKVEIMAKTKIASEAISKWAQALATQMGSILYLICGILGVLMLYPTPNDDNQTSLFDEYHGRLGLLMAYAAILQRTGMDLMMGWTSLETNMVSVERFSSLLRIHSEEQQQQLQQQQLQLQQSSSNQNDIIFENVNLRYRLYRPMVLNNFSLAIKHGSKVAIVGLTGAGKSSIFATLLRLYPISNGVIKIGSRNIMTDISLQDLRKQVCMVTQDAILPFDTLRECIGAKNDIDAREALRKVGLLLSTTTTPDTTNRFNNLDLIVMKKGICQLSVGERQLVCVARAVALCLEEGMNNHILCCDEATSSLDLNTDAQVIHTVLSLQNITTICIMHRLVHISKFDYVCVMEYGKVVEYDTPTILLQQQNGKLKSLLEMSLKKN
jgi:ATP-binding cassette subfamily C (CFTR/MRP) protein 1